MLKTYQEKLHVSKGLPMIEDIRSDEKMVERFEESRMLIAAPFEVVLSINTDSTASEDNEDVIAEVK